MHSYHSIALATSTLSSFSLCAFYWSTSNIYCFFILLQVQHSYLTAISPSLLHSGYFHSQVKRDRLGIHFSDDFPSSSIPTFPLLSFNSNTVHFDSSFTLYCHSVHPSVPSPLSHLSLRLMPSSRTLLLLHSACWNTRWRKGAGAAAAASVRPGVGVSEVGEGAISTSSRQQWWWSSAHCSSAHLVLYGPPSPPPSSPGPKRKMMMIVHFLPDLIV